MRIITTPMCEEIVKMAGITDYVVNKDPDREGGDLAVVLSETETKMDSIKIKLNTFSQIEESVLTVNDIFKNYPNKEENVKKDFLKDLKNKRGLENRIQSNKILKENVLFKLDSPWIDLKQKEILRNINRKINVQVYSKFLKDIVIDMGYNLVKINSEKPDFVVYPDYMENQIKDDLDNFESNGCRCIKVPSHGDVPLNPVERASKRYNLLEKTLCMKP